MSAAASLLARADAAQRARIKRCTCGMGWRVVGSEYMTGGCLPYDVQLRRVRVVEARYGADAPLPTHPAVY